MQSSRSSLTAPLKLVALSQYRVSGMPRRATNRFNESSQRIISTNRENAEQLETMQMKNAIGGTSFVRRTGTFSQTGPQGEPE